MTLPESRLTKTILLGGQSQAFENDSFRPQSKPCLQGAGNLAAKDGRAGVRATAISTIWSENLAPLARLSEVITIINAAKEPRFSHLLITNSTT